MKKLLMVLTFVLMTLAACVALEGDTLKITAKVPQEKPEFIMKGGFTSADATTVATQAGALLASNKDISAESITVFVKLFQSNKAKYKNTFTLTVTASDMSMTDANGTYSTTATALTTTKITTTNLEVTGSAEANVASFAMNYTNGKPVSENTAIGEASFTWEANEGLPVGDYSATITLGYTAP
ncbi:MAG: hypothetical protein MJ057_01255 [Sphaerochaetaceae bacterium]|nr:hypothetical protein [Sphaerochaetaceae bacterium]